ISRLGRPSGGLMRSRPLSLSVLLSLALTQAARADDKAPAPPREGWLPAQRAEAQVARPSWRERLRGAEERLVHVLPGGRRLVVPTKGEVRLAVVLIELADCPRPAFPKEAWEKMLFSRGEYARGPAGEPVGDRER